MIVLGYAMATLIGLSLGLLGGGGSTLTVPVLVHVLGFAAKPAIAMSLPVVGATSLVGAVSHWREGNVDLRVAFMFGVIAMAGSYTGARLAIFIPGSVQLALLGLVILVSAVLMLRPRAGVPEPPPPARTTRLLPPRLAFAAIGVGLLTGVVGVGGGFLIVPALIIMGRVPVRQAIGTSLLVIAMNTLSGFAGYYGTVDIPWQFLAGFTALTVAGVLAGTYLSRFVSAASLKRGFGVLLLVVGLFMLYQA